MFVQFAEHFRIPFEYQRYSAGQKQGFRVVQYHTWWSCGEYQINFTVPPPKSYKFRLRRHVTATVHVLYEVVPELLKFFKIKNIN